MQADALNGVSGGYNKSLHQNISGPNVIAYMEERGYTLALLPGYKASSDSGVIIGLQKSADSAAVKPSKESFSVSPPAPPVMRLLLIRPMSQYTPILPSDCPASGSDNRYVAEALTRLWVAFYLAGMLVERGRGSAPPHGTRGMLPPGVPCRYHCQATICAATQRCRPPGQSI